MPFIPDQHSTEPKSRPGENSTSPGCLAAMVIAIVIVVGVIGYVVSVGMSIGGIGEDAVPHSGFLSSTTTTISKDCLTAQEGRAPSHKPADLHGCDLSGVNLTGADLTGAKLGPNLAHIVLIEANLSGASLSYSNTWGADFTGANLTGADLTAANLTGITWHNTTCPDGSNSDSHGSTCVGYGI